MWLFDTLMWTVMGYGEEIWGWYKRKKAEEMQKTNIRWTPGVDWRTPKYMVRGEARGRG